MRAGVSIPAGSKKPNEVLDLPFASSRKVLERELATFAGNRREVGMLNPLRDKNEGMFIPGGEKVRRLFFLGSCPMHSL